jgi:arylsulfatase A-like enzyme
LSRREHRGSGPHARGGGLNRRELLASGAAWAALSAVPWRVRQERPPNVLFVFSDSHRAVTTGCYGDAQARTPHFDAFAGQGLRLDTAISNTPVCRPYRASLMSGTFSHHHGILTNRSSRNFGIGKSKRWEPERLQLPTLGSHFAAAGYRCGYVGKWHLGPVALDPGPERLGFDDAWFGARNPHDYWHPSLATGAETVVEGEVGFSTTFETDRAIELIERWSAPADEPAPPWLLMLAWGPPHDPFRPPVEFKHYEDLRLPGNVSKGRARAWAESSLPLYYALVEAVDHEFGRLTAALEATPAARDTIVVYTSDHGNLLGSHGLVGKEMPFDESTRVPFLVRWPGRIPAGKSLAAPLGAPDVFPTLAGLAGLPVPEGLDGSDRSTLLTGVPDAETPVATYLSAHETPLTGWPGWRGVRTGRHLYARLEKRPWLLFDLAEDPLQQRNLVEEDAPLAEEMDELTATLMEAHGDRWRLS